MKGPYERLKYDLRRLWECPACKRRERTPGTVTFRHCTCQMQKLDGRPVVMKLITDGTQRLTPAIQPPVVSEPPLGAGVTGSEVTGSEVTGSEVTGSEVTGSEVTGSDSV